VRLLCRFSVPNLENVGPLFSVEPPAPDSPLFYQTMTLLAGASEYCESQMAHLEMGLSVSSRTWKTRFYSGAHSRRITFSAPGCRGPGSC
jgi:hypothetical protein